MSGGRFRVFRGSVFGIRCSGVRTGYRTPNTKHRSPDSRLVLTQQVQDAAAALRAGQALDVLNELRSAHRARADFEARQAFVLGLEESLDGMLRGLVQLNEDVAASGFAGGAPEQVPQPGNALDRPLVAAGLRIHIILALPGGIDVELLGAHNLEVELALRAMIKIYVRHGVFSAISN